MTTRKGRLLVLEGIDGCGKTTQLQQLSSWLPKSGLIPHESQLVVTREPGGTALGASLRELLLHPPQDADPGLQQSCCCMQRIVPNTWTESFSLH